MHSFFLLYVLFKHKSYAYLITKASPHYDWQENTCKSTLQIKLYVSLVWHFNFLENDVLSKLLVVQFLKWDISVLEVWMSYFRTWNQTHKTGISTSLSIHIPNLSIHFSNLLWYKFCFSYSMRVINPKTATKGRFLSDALHSRPRDWECPQDRHINIASW